MAEKGTNSLNLSILKHLDSLKKSQLCGQDTEESLEGLYVIGPDPPVVLSFKLRIRFPSHDFITDVLIKADGHCRE